MPQLNMNASGATYVCEVSPHQNYVNTSAIFVGKGVARATPNLLCTETATLGLIRFTDLSLLPSGSTLVRATLHIYVRALYMPGMHRSPPVLGIWNNLTDFDPATVIWATRPAIQQPVNGTIPLGIYTLPGYVSSDITALAIAWQSSMAPSAGITLGFLQDTLGYMLIDSVNSQHPPFLLLEYVLPGCKDCPSPSDSFIENEFVEYVFNISGQQLELYSPSIDLSRAKTVSFFAKNTGASDFSLSLQISPNDTDYVNDAQQVTATPTETVFTTPYNFAKFIRARFTPVQQGDAIQAVLYCQIQTRNYNSY